MNNKILCIYHNADNDGKSSAAIVYNYFNKNVDLHGVNYGYDVPYSKIKKYDMVFCVDFSFAMQDMAKINSMVKSFVWIDHHYTSINNHDKMNLNLTGLRDNNFSACHLTWQYLHPTQPIPFILNHVGNYDIWKHDHSDTLYYEYGIRGMENNPDAPLWQIIINSKDESEEFPKLLKQNGLAIWKYIQIDYEQKCRSLAYETTFLGYKAIVANYPYTGSKLFDSLTESYDLKMTITYTKYDEWSVSLYTNKDYVNCGELASRFPNGGGHKNAAGFKSKILPHSLKSKGVK